RVQGEDRVFGDDTLTHRRLVGDDLTHEFRYRPAVGFGHDALLSFWITRRYRGHPVTRRNRAVIAPRAARTRTRPISVPRVPPAPLARSQGASTTLSAGVTPHWRMHTLRMLLTNIVSAMPNRSGRGMTRDSTMTVG